MIGLLLAALPLVGGCAERPDDPRTAGTIRMAERLDSIAEKVAPQRHAYMGSARLDSVLAVDPPDEAAERIPFETSVAREMLRAGRVEEAIDRFEQLLVDVRGRQDVLSAELVVGIVASLGTAHLKLWERENCVRARSVRACLFPIRTAGEPRAASAARAAASVHGSLARSRPDDLTVRWLLNLSHMMVGDYPEGVPARFRIPREALRGAGGIRHFRDVAPELGVDVAGHAGGAVMDDFDGDGDLDLVASSWHLSDQIRYFRQEADGGFTDATREAGLEGVVGGLDLKQADYDGDGDLDLLVLRGAWTTYGEPNSLLENRGGGVFADVTEAAGLLAIHPTQTAGWADYDGDGDLDLYVGNESGPDRRVPNQLYRNEGDGTFTEVAAGTGADVTGFVKAVAWGDVDNDGRPDLYVSRLRQPNVLLRNDGPDGRGGWRFSDVTAQAGVAEPDASFPVWFWDYDHDGWLDLFVSGYRGTPGDVAAEYLGRDPGGGAETPRLYRNDGDGTFSDVTREAGLGRAVLLTMGSNFGDLDDDGYLDLYAGTGEANLQTIVPNRMFRGTAEGEFEDVTVAGGFGHLGKGHGVAFGDLDGDGDQDVYAVMGGAVVGDVARNVLFRNPGHGGRWITLRLEGVRSNRSAIGARLRLVVSGPDGGREIHRVVGTGGSFGANSLQQEIGLGTASRIDTLEVRWPATGELDRYVDVEPGRIYRLREGAESPSHLDESGASRSVDPGTVRD